MSKNLFFVQQSNIWEGNERLKNELQSFVAVQNIIPPTIRPYASFRNHLKLGKETKS